MALHDAGAIEGRSRARAAGDGFVILIGVVAEGEVRHRAIGAGQHAQRAVQAIGRCLRDFHIAGDHRGGINRRQHAALGNDDVDRFQAPGIHRNFVINQCAEHVEHHGTAYAAWRIEVARALRGGAAEINRCRTRVAIDRNFHLNVATVVEVNAEFTVGEFVNGATHALFRVVLHVVHVGDDDIAPEVQHHRRQLDRTLVATGDLSAQIGDVLRDVAHGMRVLCQHAS